MSAQVTSTQAIIERTLAGMGYELVDIEHARDGLLRVYIDAPAGIALDDCEKASRQLSHVLMVEEVDYARLEVSSPGVDRPLKKPVDFERFAGAEISVRLRRPFEGRRNFEGVLTIEGGERYGLELIERAPAAAGAKVAPGKALKAGQASKAGGAADVPGASGRKLVFALDEIERARLVPKLKFQERRK